MRGTDMEEVKLKEMIHNAGLQEYEESLSTIIKDLKKSNSEVDEEKFLRFARQTVNRINLTLKIIENLNKRQKEKWESEKIYL